MEGFDNRATILNPTIIPSHPSEPQSSGQRQLHLGSRANQMKSRYKSAVTETSTAHQDGPRSDTRKTQPTRPGSRVRWRSQLDIHELEMNDTAPDMTLPTSLAIKSTSGLSAALVSRLTFLVALFAFLLPLFHLSPFLSAALPNIGAAASPLSRESYSRELTSRQSDSTDVCLRWAQQSALVNGTLYIYGGRSIKDSQQKSNTWNNNLLTLDLKKGWQISSPALAALPTPDGPPPVALGFLWNSHDSLYLYGGQFSDTPEVKPVPYSMWAYNILSSKWAKYQDPKTIDGEPVQRAAEGSGVSIPHLGRGLYFGGHLDRFTTPDWDISVFRVYLRALLEFTFPGSPTTSKVNSGAPAGLDGVFRNITEGGIQDTAGFTERADGLLVYVPGYSKQGIIVGLAGGTNVSFTQMNIIDVYDIAEEKWYKQSTSGPTPKPRVNPCAVATSALDGTSVQIHMFGGQRLQPAGSQEQFDDMWILSIPSFTWIPVDLSGQSNPTGRSGHTCDIWNAQMVMVGGYVGPDFSCESPGIYVFNTSSLEWVNTYTALDGANDDNQHPTQKDDPAALQGSYGYRVPVPVQKVIGGNAVGAATLTAPALTVTAGPFATGKAVTYTVTRPDGSQATEVGIPVGQAGTNQGAGGPNIAAIVAGVIAGLLALLAGYLGFCTWVYRRQLKMYKNHVEMAQRAGGLGLGLPLAERVGSAGKGSTGATSENSSTKGTGYHAIPGGGSSTGTGAHAHQSSLSGDWRKGEGYEGAGGLGGLNTARSSTDDLLAGQEPSFLGVLLSPRRSLRVINRD